MNAERWQQITNIFETALKREPAERSAFLTEQCAGDEELRREVEAMLASHDEASRFIEEPAMAVAARLVRPADSTSLLGKTIGQRPLCSCTAWQEPAEPGSRNPIHLFGGAELPLERRFGQNGS